MPAQPALHAVRQLDAPRRAWLAAYRQVRAHTQQLAACLSAEDQALQASADASPTKWHLAHTTWFFEALVLMPHAAGYRPVDERWMPLFNSYYESLGPRHPRPQRGLISRPSLAEVMGYRQQVDEALQVFIATANSVTWQAAAGALRLGLHHEQQHQELLLTDIRLALLQNPLLPAYSPLPTSAALPTQAPLPAGRLASAAPAPLRWLAWGDGPVAVGHDPETDGGFAFDNEQARHTVWLAPFALASRPVSNAEYADFIADRGYQQPSLWLSDGWALVQAEGWQAPAGWRSLATDGSAADGFAQFTLHGEQALDPNAPVCHLSAFEAAAFAAWAGARLPTEFEWEHAARQQATPDPGRQDGRWLPVADLTVAEMASLPPPPLKQLHGEVWQWTSSAYAPYPAFRPLAGPAAEYNGKFMVNQLVLRGSSFATPPGHARHSYRNFFPPAARWQFSGLRLARDQA